MAQQVVMWKSFDGMVWDSEEQASAYELKQALVMVGQQASQIRTNQFGQVDTSALSLLTEQILSDMQSKLDTVKSAIAAARALQTLQTPVATSTPDLSVQLVSDGTP